MRIEKIIGGGASWLYLIDDHARIVDSSHEDDREGMARLRRKRDESKAVAS